MPKLFTRQKDAPPHQEEHRFTLKPNRQAGGHLAASLIAYSQDEATRCGLSAF